MSELTHGPATPGGLDLFVAQHGGRAVLHALGVLDAATANALIIAVCEALGDHSSVELDLGGITFLDAAGLGAIVACSDSAQVHGWDFFVSGESPAVRRVTDALTNVDSLLRRVLSSRRPQPI